MREAVLGSCRASTGRAQISSFRCCSFVDGFLGGGRPLTVERFKGVVLTCVRSRLSRPLRPGPGPRAQEIQCQETHFLPLCRDGNTATADAQPLRKLQGRSTILPPSVASVYSTGHVPVDITIPRKASESPEKTFWRATEAIYP